METYNIKDFLPKHFLESLKILFNILDENKAGCVHVKDIESRWNDRGENGLPPGVLAALKKVAPKDGFLTFDLFVSGLKMALLSNAHKKLKSCKEAEEKKDGDRQRLDTLKDPAMTTLNSFSKRPTISVARSKSFQQPEIRSIPNATLSSFIERPPRPARPTIPSQTVPEVPPRDVRSHNLLSELKTWHKQHDLRKTGTEPIYSNLNPPKKLIPSVHRRIPSSKDTSRRHTLTCGIDLDHAQNIRLKQLEEEKAILLQGQKVVEETNDWYKKKLEQVSVKEKYARHYLFKSNSLVAHREQMNYQRSKIQNANQHLRSLMDSSDKGFPHHMNLSFRETSSSNTHLKIQNRLLAKEVHEKDSKISQLESEKRTLIRELFEQKSDGIYSDGEVSFV